MLLIITDRNDFTADYVIAFLIEKGLQYTRLNSEDIGDADVHLLFKSSKNSHSLRIVDVKIDINTITSVWYRRRFFPKVPSFVRRTDKEFAFGELIHLFEGLLPGPETHWVDYPTKVWRAERKLQQLVVAPNFGFKIPDTQVSTNPISLRQFYKKCDGEVVCKPIFRGLHVQGKGAKAAYTRKVCELELDEISENKIFPTLLQKRIRKTKDLRITVVGQQFFGVEILTPADIIDWREPDASPNYRFFDVPSDLMNRCLEFLKYFGLSYGAFDFAVSKNGTIFFLELNAVGEWAWLDRELDLGIRPTLVQHLYKKSEEFV